jgi:hypothetical protein
MMEDVFWVIKYQGEYVEGLKLFYLPYFTPHVLKAMRFNNAFKAQRFIDDYMSPDEYVAAVDVFRVDVTVKLTYVNGK